ncbi:MAG: hypothetical protein C0432_03315 [Candidatus Puniceispirillum sp.]|nr:hypothetical protein [Candidatus Pelagibacter sp.]MBA4283303.1 hypothetical protein [Candidatus Puniceispirillum sp.]
MRNKRKFSILNTSIMSKKYTLIYIIPIFFVLQIAIYLSFNYLNTPLDLHDISTQVADLDIEQSFDNVDISFTNGTNQKTDSQERDFLWKKNYFSPWLKEVQDLLSTKKNIQNKNHEFSIETAKKINTFLHQNLYRENYRELTDKDRKEIQENTNFESLNSINQPAIIIHPTPIKAIPTDYTLFHNPQIAGEGYPFDTLQYHQLKPGQPIRISHNSKDGLWAYVLTNQNFAGWIPAEHLVVLDPMKCKKLYQSQWGVFQKDGIILKNKYGIPLCKSTVGMYLPVSKGKTIYFPTNKTNKKTSILQLIKVQISEQSSFLFEHPTWSIQKSKEILTPLLGKVYGWGTLYGERDCSGLIQDYASVFGIWLGRNSKSQSEYGNLSFDCSKMTTEEKLKLIKDHAIPFKTLLYRSGHIGIFVGFDKDKQPLMMHSVWGFKLKKNNNKGRYIIGKSIISRLDYGHSHPQVDKHEIFLNLMSKMTILNF